MGSSHSRPRTPATGAKKLRENAAVLCYDTFKSERPMIDFYQSPGFTLEKLKEFNEQRQKR